MKKLIFTGKSDKRDLLLYLCKLLSSQGQRVLLVDVTDFRKYRYSIGSRQPRLPLMDFSGFDVSDGIPDLYHKTSYDYILYDVESLFLEYEVWSDVSQIIWVTSFDRFEVESSAEWFRILLSRWPQLQQMDVLPVYIRTVDSFLTDEYIMSFMDGLELNWKSSPVWIPWNELDTVIQLENDYHHRLHIHRISRSYKYALIELAVQLAGWGMSETKKALRVAERRKA